jgi:hypothetical protein
VSSLIEQYPLPKVGQSVRLHNGKTAKVVNVFKANAVLKMMTEVEAIALATNAQARFGQNWREVYYHLDIMFQSGVMDVVDTSKVREVFDTP